MPITRLPRLVTVPKPRRPTTKRHLCDGQNDETRNMTSVRKYNADWLLLHRDSYVGITIVYCPFCGAEL